VSACNNECAKTLIGGFALRLARRAEKTRSVKGHLQRQLKSSADFSKAGAVACPFSKVTMATEGRGYAAVHGPRRIARNKCGLSDIY
jgi:hypothetical protein